MFLTLRFETSAVAWGSDVESGKEIAGKAKRGFEVQLQG
jgi:hypothetical protein